MITAPDPASTNTHQEIVVRYVYLCNQCCRKYRATGIATAHEMITRLIQSFDNIFQILNTLAPNTFLTPISFVLCSAINVARPNKPRQEINIASTQNTVDIFPICSSSENFML